MLTFTNYYYTLTNYFLMFSKNNDRNQEKNIKSRKHEIHPYTRENGRYQKNSWS